MCYKHEHPLRPTGAAVGSATQEDRERVERMQQLHRTMQLLVHASACSDRHCPSTNCMKVKALFQHGLTCPTKVAGGCMLCRRMWNLLQIHAKGCRTPNCPVPRCRDLKEYRRRAAQVQEDRRRQAWMQMHRQQGMQPQGMQQPQQQGMQHTAAYGGAPPPPPPPPPPSRRG